jgi:ribosomal protein L1
LEENIGNVNGHAGAQQRRNGSSHLGFGKSSMDGEKVNENKKSKAVISEITNKYNNLLVRLKKSKQKQFKS